MGRGAPAVFEFNPWFNSIVGGRGTGKSTVVHMLRLAYRRADELGGLPSENEARMTFQRFVRAPKNRYDEVGALDYEVSRQTEVSVVLRRQGAQERLWWRQNGSGDVVEEYTAGAWRTAPSQSVSAERFALKVLGQGQIAALASENQRALLDMIDEAADVGPVVQRLDESKQRFLSLRAQIREVEGKLKSRDDLQGRLADVLRKLQSFEDQAHAAVLRSYQLRSRQNREIDKQLEVATAAAARFKIEAEHVAGEQIPPGLFDATDKLDSQVLVVIARLHSALTQSAMNVQNAANELAALVDRERHSITTSEWYLDKARSETEYASFCRTLSERGVTDPSQYGALVQDRQRLEQELKKIDALQEQRERLEVEITEALATGRDSRQQVSNLRSAFLQRVLAGNPYVRISLDPYGSSPRAIESSLREQLEITDGRFEEDVLPSGDDEPNRGLVADLLKARQGDPATLADRMSVAFAYLGERFRLAAVGRGDFGGQFKNYIQRESSRRPEFLDRLLLWTPEDSLKVEYSRSGDGNDFRPIQQASAGQRAAAMLAFLLVHGEEPLVLDQPEDDLDNHLIYELVVQQIRGRKQTRQLIVVTHNPNIVVNGDAELVHVMDFRQGQCRVVQAGALQEIKIRDEVCRVMEGGREAFERRYRRIGGEAPDV